MVDSRPPSFPRFHYWKSSLQGWWLIVSIILLLWGLVGNIRSEFIPAADQEKWRLPVLFPRVPWYWLVISFLAVTLIAILEGSFREYRKRARLMFSETQRLQLLLDAERAKSVEPKLVGKIDWLELDVVWDTEHHGIERENTTLLKSTFTLRVTLRNESIAPTTVSGFRLSVLWANGQAQGIRLPVENYSVTYNIPRSDGEWGYETHSRMLAPLRDDIEVTNTNHRGSDLRFLARGIPSAPDSTNERPAVRNDVTFRLDALDRKQQAHKIYEGTWDGLPEGGSITRTIY